ncbi:MAG: hypothetical protein J7498_06135 [Sphingobium sp.]|nr:hypothetical protein [Sphingobium sp.]
MDGLSFIASAGLIILLLPVAIATCEKKRAPDGVYLALAAGGVGFAVLRHGLAGGVLAATVGIVCLVLTAAIIGFIHARWQTRLLLGRHIKLLGAGATWLGAMGAAIMMSIAIFLFIFFIGTSHMRKSSNIRPEFSAIAAISILIVQIQHSTIGFY